jgi:hypothetical protein
MAAIPYESTTIPTTNTHVDLLREKELIEKRGTGAGTLLRFARLCLPISLPQYHTHVTASRGSERNVGIMEVSTRFHECSGLPVIRSLH